MLSLEEKTKLDADVSAAFASVNTGDASDWRKSSKSRTDELNARSAAAARRIYDLTRPLGLERQLMADALPWKAPAGIPLNAFARRVAAGLLGDGLPGYVRPVKAKAVRKARTMKHEHCPHCGGSLKVAA